jgi:hypothetical protein
MFDLYLSSAGGGAYHRLPLLHHLLQKGMGGFLLTIILETTFFFNQ